MEGPSSGNGDVRDFKTQAQSPQITPITAEEPAPGALSALGSSSCGKVAGGGGHAAPEEPLQRNSLIPFRRQETVTGGGICRHVAKKHLSGVVLPKKVKPLVVFHPECV